VTNLDLSSLTRAADVMRLLAHMVDALDARLTDLEAAVEHLEVYAL